MMLAFPNLSHLIDALVLAAGRGNDLVLRMHAKCQAMEGENGFTLMRA